jgi:hypothetical protein
MSATETAAVPAEEVKAVETPAPAPEAAPAAEAPAAVRFFGYLLVLLAYFHSRKHLKKKQRQRYITVSHYLSRDSK